MCAGADEGARVKADELFERLVLPALEAEVNESPEYERLRSAEVDTRLVPIVGGAHSLRGPHRQQAEQATLEFFGRLLKPANPVKN